MENVLITFMEDVAQEVYGESDLTYKEVYDFIDFAKRKDKIKVMRFYYKWNEMDIDEICTKDLTDYVRMILNNQTNFK